jgi:hypothetical protein
LDRERNLQDEEVVVEFFGQLWAIDSLLPRCKPRPLSPSTDSTGVADLFWIQRDLVEARSFLATNCFPVAISDCLEKLL